MPGTTDSALSEKHVWPFLAGGVSVLLAGLVAASFHPWLDTAGSAMIFLVAILWSGLYHGRSASLFTAVLAAITCDYFFFKPYYDLSITSGHHGITFAVFALVAFTTATLTARIHEEAAKHREQRDVARKRSGELAALLSLSQAMGACRSVEEVRITVEEKLGAFLASPAALHLGAAPPDSGDQMLALATPQGNQGWLVLKEQNVAEELSPELLQTMAELIAITIERIGLRQQMVNHRIEMENQRFRAALLASISHDFRTPLGSVIGAASTLLSEDAHIEEPARGGLLKTILQSAQRLNRFVRNILDLTRVEADAVNPNLDWVDMSDVVGSALAATEELLTGWKVSVDIPQDLPFLRLDFVLTEHVFINLFENAAKFASPGNSLEILGRLDGHEVHITVFNSGSSIAGEDANILFEQFQRGGSETRGSGLGLAICRGFLAAQGASIELEPQSKRDGVAFRMRFPVGREIVTPQEEPV